MPRAPARPAPLSDGPAAEGVSAWQARGAESRGEEMRKGTQRSGRKHPPAPQPTAAVPCPPAHSRCPLQAGLGHCSHSKAYDGASSCELISQTSPRDPRPARLPAPGPGGPAPVLRVVSPLSPGPRHPRSGAHRLPSQKPRRHRKRAVLHNSNSLASKISNHPNI